MFNLGEDKRGFSLVEMLTVLVIVSLLATISITAVQNSIAQARHASVQEGFFLLRQTMLNYFFEYGTYGPAQSAGPLCTGGMFDNKNFTRVRIHVIGISDGIESCAIGPDGNTFAYSLLSETHGTVCIDQGRMYSDMDATGGGISLAGCG